MRALICSANTLPSGLDAVAEGVAATPARGLIALEQTARSSETAAIAGLDAGKALERATIGSAAVLGMDDEIEHRAGQADGSRHARHRSRPRLTGEPTYVVGAASRADVTRTVVDGEVVYRCVDGTCGVDAADIRAVGEASRRLWTRP